MLYLCKNFSNWLDHEDCTPKLTLPNPTKLRRALQDFGRYTDAEILLKSEGEAGGFEDTDESLLPYYEYLSLMRKLEKSISEPVLCWIAVARLDFFLKLSELQKFDQARIQFVKGFQLVMLASAYSNGSLEISPRFCLLLNKAVLSMSTGLGIFEKAAQSLALARVAYQKLDFFTYRVNLRAASRLWEGLRRSIVSPMTGSAAALCNQLIFEEIRFEVELAHSAFHLGMAILTFELLFISRNGK